MFCPNFMFLCSSSKGYAQKKEGKGQQKQVCKLKFSSQEQLNSALSQIISRELIPRSKMNYDSRQKKVKEDCV